MSTPLAISLPPSSKSGPNAAPLRRTTPNLMPFHISYTGPANMTAFMKVEKLKKEDGRLGGELGDESFVDVAVKKEVKKEGDESQNTESQTTETETQDSTDGIARAPTVEDVAMADASAKESVAASAAVDVEMQDATTRNNSPTTLAASSSSTTLAASASSATVATASASSSSIDTTPTTTKVDTTHPHLDDIDNRYVSSFRGRAIHGLEVSLPEGWGGLVLQAAITGNSTSSKAAPVTTDKSSKGKERENPSKVQALAGDDNEDEEEYRTTRPRRRGRFASSALPKTGQVYTVDGEDDSVAKKEGVQGTSDQPIVVPDSNPSTTDNDNKNKDEGNSVLRAAKLPPHTKILTPTSHFTSFMLWQPDRPVDKGRDEYVRMVGEWLALANEIHRTDIEVDG